MTKDPQFLIALDFAGKHTLLPSCFPEGNHHGFDRHQDYGLEAQAERDRQDLLRRRDPRLWRQGAGRRVKEIRPALSDRRQSAALHKRWFGVLKLEEARQRARRALVDLGDGKDPAAQKAEAKEGAKQTFKAVADDYLAVLDARVEAGELRPRSLVEIKRHLLKHFKPLHRLVISSISRATVATRLREIAKQNGPGAADRTRSNVSTFFAWAIGEGICEINPVDGTNRQVNEYVERERSLIQMDGEKPNYDELIAVWKGLPDSEYGKILRLLILTLCRRDEIGSLDRAEIDKENRLIRLPGERTKNGRGHVVPLSDPALAILNGIDAKDGRDLVFGLGRAAIPAGRNPRRNWTKR